MYLYLLLKSNQIRALFIGQKCWKTSWRKSMDPAKFGISTIPLNHTYYGPITPESLAGKNSGKIAVVTGASRGTFHVPRMTV